MFELFNPKCFCKCNLTWQNVFFILKKITISKWAYQGCFSDAHTHTHTHHQLCHFVLTYISPVSRAAQTLLEGAHGMHGDAMINQLGSKESSLPTILIISYLFESFFKQKMSNIWMKYHQKYDKHENNKTLGLFWAAALSASGWKSLSFSERH